MHTMCFLHAVCQQPTESKHPSGRNRRAVHSSCTCTASEVGYYFAPSRMRRAWMDRRGQPAALPSDGSGCVRLQAGEQHLIGGCPAAEDAGELWGLAECRRIEVSDLAGLGRRLEHQGLEGIATIESVDLDAPQYRQLTAVVPDARHGGDLGDHRLSHHVVHHVRDKGHVVSGLIDAIEFGREFQLDVIKLQVSQIAHGRGNRRAALGERLVRTDRRAARRGRVGDACALEGPDSAITAHANVRREEDEELAFVWHVVSVRR
mmetsp:Transcript_53182/g.105755  ORF Transcript_53182/g.105755 Transcript_53182/m.105755 type:complete len:262 (+) Transcript_53182:153-938(+)